ncbi:hypothetical protein [Actinomadura rubrisoli]|uniref:Uncharacterized protein n=1 Tax=Actinomadura rubrisoli TaxID=2530368 RepID=A0A4R5BQP9_9ACTN|nr:hypothetical protein [Actinomadura rubrisoli]TDD89278.1 hypothetical protein E1298_14375 [Actinomadura rubrisoli]
MPEPLSFAEELRRRLRPAVGVWNRLEGRPRTTGFDRALRAEVRDPLWLLTRQWQLGEFRGADAGSPVTATYSVTPSRPTRFRSPGGPPEDLQDGRPLEAVAERRPVPFAYGAEKIAFDLRLAIGHRWLRLLDKAGLLGQLLTYDKQYIRRYPIALPDPGRPEDTASLAHPEVWAMMQVIAGRRMDGYLFYLHLKAGKDATEGINILPLLGHRELLVAQGKRLVAWFDALIDQPTGVTQDRPDGNATWDTRTLEHRFSVAASTPGGTEKVLTAQEYPGGLLDWHAFSVDTRTPVGGAKPPERPLARTAFPAPVRFSGMPLPRWWALEDGRTNFAAVRPESTDLARLIFLEFALVYSNDWYQMPCDLPAGTIAAISGMTVTDVFNQRQWIGPAGAGEDDDTRRWTMFTLDTIGRDTVPADTSLLLPPSVPKVAEGPALEEVLLVRDENANLVWGIEQTVRMPTGESRRGGEAAAEVVAFRRRDPVPPPGTDPPRAPISYLAMNVIPEHWIPFIPVHVPGDNREVQLQRAAMPSVVDGKPVRPRTTLLRTGYDLGRQYFVNEEEVPRTGTRLTVAYNRTRWRDGRVVLWLSAQRGIGRGEGSSGLAFDLVIDTPPQNP